MRSVTINDEDLNGKCAVIDWNQYKKICFDLFIIDEEMQIKQLDEVICKIEEMDKESIIYAATYPIEKKEHGISAYCDMLWIKTKLTCIELENLFTNYREIEPSAIFNLTPAEKSTIELYIGKNLQCNNFEQVATLFKTDEIKIIYWD